MSDIPFLEYIYCPASEEEAACAYHPCSASIPPRKETMHKHDYCEIALVRSGEFSVLSEDVNTAFSGPCLEIFQRNSFHSQVDYSRAVYERYLLRLDKHIPRILEPIVKQIDLCAVQTITIIPLSDTQINWLYAIMDHMSRLVDREGIAHTDERVEIPLRCLLEEIYYIIQSQPNARLNFCHLNIQYVLTYIKEHLLEKITADTLSAYMHCGKTKLNEDFKKYTGRTVHQYIIEERLALSLKYLEKHYSIGNIAKLCGFRDGAHYVKTFQKHYAMTPAQYRDKADRGGPLD